MKTDGKGRNANQKREKKKEGKKKRTRKNNKSGGGRLGEIPPHSFFVL